MTDSDDRNADNSPLRMRAREVAREILEERLRQIYGEGYLPSADDRYDADLAVAAACYAMPPRGHNRKVPPPPWPWPSEAWKPKDRRRDLVRAAALLAAEIERLDRLDASDGGDVPELSYDELDLYERRQLPEGPASALLQELLESGATAYPTAIDSGGLGLDLEAWWERARLVARGFYDAVDVTTLEDPEPRSRIVPSSRLHVCTAADPWRPYLENSGIMVIHPDADAVGGEIIDRGVDRPFDHVTVRYLCPHCKTEWSAERAP